MAKDIPIEALNILARALIKKYGSKLVEGLLTDDFCIEKNREKGVRKAYVRHYKSGNPLYMGKVDGKDDFLEPEYLLIALEDAREEFNYSNWTTGILDRAGEIIIRYCLEHDIPITFKEDEERKQDD